MQKKCKRIIDYCRHPFLPDRASVTIFDDGSWEIRTWHHEDTDWDGAIQIDHLESEILDKFFFDRKYDDGGRSRRDLIEIWNQTIWTTENRHSGVRSKDLNPLRSSV